VVRRANSKAQFPDYRAGLALGRSILGLISSVALNPWTSPHRLKPSAKP